MKKLLFAAAAALMAASAQAEVCGLLALNSTCTFATDTSGGQVIFRNPDNVDNVGSGGIAPFLGVQRNDVSFGVNTDSPVNNTLPLDTKRDNTGTFTNTFTQQTMGVVNVGGINYFEFFLDINESNGGGNNLLSLDTVRIWDAKSAAAQLLHSGNVTTFGVLDALFSSLIYAMGPGNTLLLDYDLFQGSGNGYDLSMLVPVATFAGVALDSRIIFGTGFGGFGGTYGGSDGFEEWAYRIGTGPQCEVNCTVPEPASLGLVGLALLGLALGRRKAGPEDGEDEDEGEALAA